MGVVSAMAVLALLPRHAEARGRSTPEEERARFVAAVRALESDPLAENATAVRQQLRAWTIDVPDIRFKVCPQLLGQTVGDDDPYSRELALQVVLSGAVLTIEDPGAARDDVAVYAAGVEGALRAYEALLKARPDTRLAGLDDLVGKRNRGELVDHVAGIANEECPRSNALLIAAPVGATVGLILAMLVARFGGRTPAVGREHLREGTSAKTAARVRRIVLGCVAYYAIAGIALHFLEPEYDPRYQFMSDYAWGAYGWLMTTTFFVLGLAVLTVAAGVRGAHQPTRSARLGFGLLVIGAIFVCLAGVFRGFPLHDIAGAVGIPSLAMATLILSWSFRRVAGWQAIHSTAFPIAVGMLVAIVSMIVDVGMPGLQQRAFLALLLVWLAVVVHRLVRVTAGPVEQPSRTTA